MIGGLFLQFLDHDKLNTELCDAPLDTPLFASDSVKNEMEACQLSVGFSAKGSMLSLLEQSLYLGRQNDWCSDVDTELSEQTSDLSRKQEYDSLCLILGQT